MSIHFIIGGARSGKSRLAEASAKLFSREEENRVCFIATAEPKDKEMADRIAQHKLDRPENWQVLESPIELAASIKVALETHQCIVVDCLTLWLSNCLCQQNEQVWQQQRKQFFELLSSLKATKDFQQHIIFVSNEVGHGIVPLGELSREFVDQAGWLHQELAKHADKVDFVMAGIPMSLKSHDGVLK